MSRSSSTAPDVNITELKNFLRTTDGSVALFFNRYPPRDLSLGDTGDSRIVGTRLALQYTFEWSEIKLIWPEFIYKNSSEKGQQRESFDLRKAFDSVACCGSSPRLACLCRVHLESSIP
jgi:hypothetical protein